MLKHDYTGFHNVELIDRTIQQAYLDWQSEATRLVAEGKSLDEVCEAWREYARRALEANDLNADER